MDADGYAQSVTDAINQTAGTAGMDPAYWRAVASIESSLNPSSNYNRGTQYKGLFQVGGNEFASHGRGNIFNAMDNARAAASLAQANNNTFRQHFGRDPTPIETYMMHQQGPGFYTHGTMTNIAGNLPPEARTPENMTPQGFERYWANQLERRAQGFGASGGGEAPPSVAGTRQWSPPAAPSASYGAPSTTSVKVPSDVMASGAAATPSSAATPSTDTSDTGGGSDFGAQLSAIKDRIAQQDTASQGPQMQPMQLAQPMMTPAMYRARLLSQAMMARDMGLPPPTTGSTT